MRPRGSLIFEMRLSYPACCDLRSVAIYPSGASCSTIATTRTDQNAQFHRRVRWGVRPYVPIILEVAPERPLAPSPVLLFLLVCGVVHRRQTQVSSMLLLPLLLLFVVVMSFVVTAAAAATSAAAAGGTSLCVLNEPRPRSTLRAPFPAPGPALPLSSCPSAIALLVVDVV